MSELMLRVDNISKRYTLGQIGGTTLRDELQRLDARLRRREDPTRKIGARSCADGETFMALDGVSFDVQKGERVGIIGHNGAGKSTLLKLISRVTAPTAGRIGLNGRVASMLEVGTGFHGELTGRENIYMNGAILGMKKREIDAKLEDIIDFSECRQFIDTPVKRYSSGMYVKLAFSVAAHLDSEIMIMDEVLAVGDTAFQTKCLEKMSDVSRSEGRTILYVSHNMNTIRQLCGRCIVLEGGRLAYDGGVEEGIARYFGRGKSEQNNLRLAHMRREPHFENHPVTMEAMEVLGVKDGVLTAETMVIRLTCAASRRFDDARFRVIVKNNLGQPVTMLTTDRCFAIGDDRAANLAFGLELSSLAPGSYSIDPVVYSVDAFGNVSNLDVLRGVYTFNVPQKMGQNNNMAWLAQYWGYTVGAPIKIIEEA